MAGELKHKDVGPELTYAEYHATDSHTIDGVDAGTVIAGKATLAEVKADADIADAISNSHASGSDNQDLSGYSLTTHLHAGTYLESETDPAFTAWDKDYGDLINKPTIPDELADLSDDATHRTVTDTEKSTWNGKTDLTTVKADTDVASAISLKHTQGTDQGLDTGGANAVTAAQAKAGYTHSGVAHAPSDAVSLSTVKADSDIADAISKKHAVGDSIASSISDGDTTHSPDGNSVYDALALKLDKSSNLSDVANAATAFGNIKQSATTSATGVVELATQAEVLAGTDTSRAVVPVDLHAKISVEKNPLAFAQGIAMTYAASGGGITVANNANINVGTGNFTPAWKGSLPDWTPGASTFLINKYSTTGYQLYISSANKISLYLKGAGGVVLNWSATSAVTFADSSEHEIVPVITRETALADGSVALYVDNVLVETATISAGSGGSLDTVGNLYISGQAGLRTASKTSAAYIFNRALTAAEVLSLHQNGVAEADKWGNQTGPVSGCVLALEPEGIQPAPGQWLDSSSNKLHAWQPAAGSSLTRYKNTFEIRGINTWAGTHEAQSIAWATDASKAILPAGCYIDSIIGVITGATIEDIIIGDGSDTDRWVEATTGLAAGTVSFTIANHISDGSHYEMVVDPDANFTGSIEWTIRGTILD